MNIKNMKKKLLDLVDEWSFFIDFDIWLFKFSLERKAGQRRLKNKKKKNMNRKNKQSK